MPWARARTPPKCGSARALDKLREFFLHRGISVPAAALAAAISGNSIQAAPAGLAASVAVGAVQGAALSASTLTLVKGAIHIMTSAKISVAIGVRRRRHYRAAMAASFHPKTDCQAA